MTGASPETKRIQRKRTKGWRMPANTVYVGRPTRWGNLYTVGIRQCGCRSAGECHHNTFRCETREEAVESYRWLVTEFLPEKTREEIRAALRGKNLACWCPLDQPCHADVLLRIANGDSQ